MAYTAHANDNMTRPHALPLLLTLLTLLTLTLTPSHATETLCTPKNIGSFQLTKQYCASFDLYTCAALGFEVNITYSDESGSQLLFHANITDARTIQECRPTSANCETCLSLDRNSFRLTPTFVHAVPVMDTTCTFGPLPIRDHRTLEPIEMGTGE